MADEIKARGAVTIVNGNSDERVSWSFNADQAANQGPYPGFLLIGTTEESLNLTAEITAPGVCSIKNLDAANYIEVGSATGSYLVKVLAGETWVMRLSASTLYLKANTAAVKTQIKAFGT